MALSGPAGRTGSGGWFLDGTGEDPARDRDTSIHESQHYRLDLSTTFGAVMIAYAGLVDAGLGDRERLAQLRDTCRTVHESAATYLTSLSLGQLDDRRHLSIHYFRYYDGMDGLVGGHSTPAWLRYHVTMAVARACMQPVVMPVIEDVGLLGLTASSFRNAALPDERFRRLRADPPDLAAIDAVAAEASDLAVADERRVGGELLAGWFDLSNFGVYEAYEAAAWDAVCERLVAQGCEVDAIDAQLAVGRDLLERGRSLGAAYDLVAHGSGEDPEGGAWPAIVPLDKESIALPARRRAHLQPTDDIEDWSVLTAEFHENEHLHLSIRPTNSYRHFEWKTDVPAGPVCLRRTLQTPTGRSIEHIDLTGRDPFELAVRWHGAVVATIAESMLTDSRVIPWLGEVGEERVLLSDMPLIPRLQSWATRHGRFRYMFLSVEAADAKSVVMLARFESGDGSSSSPLARPVTPQVVNTLRQALAELDPTNVWSTEDNALVDELPGIGVAIFHIIGEDCVFDLIRRDRQ